MRKMLGAIGASRLALLLLALVALSGATYAIASNDNDEPACPPGSHFKVTEPNGNELVIKRDIRDLPKGAYIQAGQIKVYRDGRVTGDAEVECIEPTE